MLERIVLAHGPGAQDAWTFASGELGSSAASHVYSGRLYLKRPWAKPDPKILVASAAHWGDFREAIRLLNRSTDFAGFSVLGLDSGHPPIIPPLDVQTHAIWLARPQGPHQARCQASELLAALGLPSERLEALIREGI